MVSASKKVFMLLPCKSLGLENWALLCFFIANPVRQIIFATLAFPFQPKLILGVFGLSAELVEGPPLCSRPWTGVCQRSPDLSPLRTGLLVGA